MINEGLKNKIDNPTGKDAQFRSDLKFLNMLSSERREKCIQGAFEAAEVQLQGIQLDEERLQAYLKKGIFQVLRQVWDRVRELSRVMERKKKFLLEEELREMSEEHLKAFEWTLQYLIENLGKEATQLKVTTLVMKELEEVVKDEAEFPEMRNVIKDLLS